MSLILSGTEGVGDVDGSAATPAIRGTDTNTGIFFPAADTIAFAEGGVESARLDASGVMTLGTTAKTTDTDFKLSTDNRTYGIRNDRAGSRFDIVDFTAGSVRASITSGGDLLVGTTNASGSAGVGSKVLSTTAGFIFAQVTAETTNGTATAYNYYSTGAGAFRFYVGAGGTVFATSTTISSISDQRLKQNIQDLDVGLDKIMALKPRKFDWKEGKGKDIKGDRGWIAQEFEQVFPDMIDTWKDPAPEGKEPYKSVRADLIPVLVKAIQEQQALIQTLTARVAALESN
jgi:hypothetical protein